MPSISPTISPASFRHFQVLGDGRLRERKLVDDLAAVARVVGEQQPQDADAGGMADRLREHRQVDVECVGLL